MTGRDEYYNRAKQEGYRTRSAYKLKQLDDAAGLFAGAETVVDLGAAPGGWLQVAAERLECGTVLGVDRQGIDPVEAPEGVTVETLRGDLEDDDTVAAIVDSVGEADLVLSDMAPNVTGEYDLDHARSVHLARRAHAVASEVLQGGGDLAVKVFEGRDLEDLRADLEADFEYVRTEVPDATRESSSELYLVAKGRLTAPVAVGEELTVDVHDRGDEGDGVATVDGFTLFVPGAEPGETVAVTVTDLQRRFGIAERR